MATQVVELTGDEAALLRSLQKVIDKERDHERQLGRMSDAGNLAGQDIEKAMARVEDANSKAIKGLLGDLGKLGPEAKQMSTRLASELQRGAQESAGGMDAILDKLKQIDPTIAASAAKIRVEMAEADATTRFDNSLAELRKLSPEAAKAAGTVRTEMSLADRQVKFDNIIKELKKVDPAAAAEAVKLRGTLQKSADDGTQSWDGFAQKAVGSLKTLAGAYVGAQGISAAIGVVNGLLEDQGKLIDAASEKQLNLAKAQQETIKNLAALTRVQQSELLTSSVGQIASTAGVGDASAITSALGGAISGGATEAQAISAVTSAALLNRLTPEKIGATSSAAVDFGKATGVDDARANIALLTSTGTQSRIEDPQALAKNLAPALSNAVNTVMGQDSQEATREAAAIFSAFTQATADTQGEKSRTATIQFTAELSKFFKDFEGQQRDARSALGKLEKKLDEGTATESEEFRAGQLRAFIAQAGQMQDPGTLFGRIEALQQNEGVRDQFFSREFGEAAFKGAFQELGDASSSIAQQIQDAKKVIEVDSAGFDRLLDATTSLTPQLRAANIAAGVQAAAEIRDVQDIEGGTLSQIRDITESTLARTRIPGLTNMRLNMKEEAGIQPSFFSGNAGTAAEESVSNLDRLLSRRSRIASDGITAQEQPVVAELDAAIKGIRELVTQQADSLDPATLQAAARRAGARSTAASAQFQTERAEFFAQLQIELQQRAVTAAEAQVTATERQNALVEEQNALLAETADNTAPRPADPAAVSAAAFAQEDAQ